MDTVGKKIDLEQCLPVSIYFDYFGKPSNVARQPKPNKMATQFREKFTGDKDRDFNEACCSKNSKDLLRSICFQQKKILKKISSINSALECQRKICISPEDIGVDGYLIDAPGQYCLCKNTSFSPINSARGAIVINSDHVLLDLSDHDLSQGNTVPITYGIIIVDSFDIVIRNGTIRNFLNSGVRLERSQQIIFDNVKFLENGRFVGAAEPRDGIGAVSIVDCKDIFARNTIYTRNYSNGIGCTKVNNIWVQNSSFNETLGIVLPATGNTVASGFTCSYSRTNPQAPINRSENIFLINNNFARSLAQEDAVGATITAFFIGVPVNPDTDFHKNIVIMNCTSQGHVTSNLNSAPFAYSTNSSINVFIKNSSGNGASFSNAGRNQLIEDCEVSNIISQKENNMGFIGFFNSENINYRRCVASNIRATVAVNSAGLSPIAAGFAAVMSARSFFGLPPVTGRNYSYEDCIVKDVSDLNGVGAGILIQNIDTFSIKRCSFARCSNGVLIRNIVTIPPSPTQARNGIISENEANNNTVAGFNDTSAPGSLNVYIGNRAKGSPNNYIGLLPNIPVYVWDLAAPALDPVLNTLGPLVNLSIV